MNETNGYRMNNKLVRVQFDNFEGELEATIFQLDKDVPGSNITTSIYEVRVKSSLGWIHRRLGSFDAAMQEVALISYEIRQELRAEARLADQKLERRA